MHSLPRRFLRAKIDRREGAIAVFSAFCLVILLSVLALTVDIGFLLNARAELQKSADSAALAACSELQARTFNESLDAIRLAAARFARLNRVASQDPELDLNSANLPSGDIVVGYVAEPFSAESPMEFENSARFNSVLVRVDRTSNRNGELPLFFARIWGFRKQALSAYARASFIQNFRGFRAPNGDETLPILPIGIREEAWHQLLNGEGADELNWDRSTHQVVEGSDGFCELNVFPQQIDAGGNFGLLDVGSSKSHADTIERQIRDGLSQADLDYHGGKLELNDDGQLLLSGLTGKKIGISEPPLAAITGQARIMPVYREVAGNGTGANFTIVGFAGVRVLTVDLSTKDKIVMIQPAPQIIRGGIPSDPSESASEMIYSSVRLTR